MSNGTVKLSTDIVALAKTRYPDADVSVSVWDGWTANTRFARNEPTTNGDVQETEIGVTVAFGKRHASASANQTEEASIVTVVDRAAAMARMSPEDAEWMPALGPQDFAAVPEAFDPDVAGFDATRRATKVGAAIAEAKAKGVIGAGYLECDAHDWALASSRGLSAFHRRTSADMTMTARTADGTGSGWGGRSTHRAADSDASEVGRVASDKGVRSVQPRPLNPGRYTVILEPAAVAELLGFFTWALDARHAEEGRSFFSKAGGATKLGEKLFPDWMTFLSDPDEPGDPRRTVRRAGGAAPARRMGRSRGRRRAALLAVLGREAREVADRVPRHLPPARGDGDAPGGSPRRGQARPADHALLVHALARTEDHVDHGASPATASSSSRTAASRRR